MLVHLRHDDNIDVLTLEKEENSWHCTIQFYGKGRVDFAMNKNTEEEAFIHAIKEYYMQRQVLSLEKIVLGESDD